MKLSHSDREAAPIAAAKSRRTSAHPFANPREFGSNQFVYTVISPRARGLSIGVNMNPDKFCNFDCVYCEVDRSSPPVRERLDVQEMIEELDATLALANNGGLAALPRYAALPDNLVTLRHVALSGDGEPTLAPNFQEAVEAILHLRATRKHPFFKIVLITNASGLDRPEALSCVKLFTSEDEVWAKLDAGTQLYYEKVNRTSASLERVLANILALAQTREVVIQSLFPSINGQVIPMEEIHQFAHRLRELKEQGAKIKLVQVYSADRPTEHAECGHLPLRTLSEIASITRKIAGLPTEVF